MDGQAHHSRLVGDRATDRLPDPPHDHEVAAELDLPVERLEQVSQLSRSVTSLDTPVGEAGDAVFGDLLEDTTAVAPSEVVSASLLRHQLTAMIEQLAPRERCVIERRFGFGGQEPVTLQEVGDDLGLTRERIRQIEVKVLAKLRRPALAIYLDA